MKNCSKIIGFPISANNANRENVYIHCIDCSCYRISYLPESFLSISDFFVFSDQSDRDSLFLIL